MNTKSSLIIFLSLFLSGFSFSADYFWVGGGGNWSDLSHWATSSGGSVKHVVVPGLNDNVYFDLNSGFTSSPSTNRVVTLNGTINYCKNMVWNGAPASPILSGINTCVLYIYGSLTLQSTLTYRVHTTYFRSDNSGETIQTNGVSIGTVSGTYPGNIIFNGNGSWTLQSNLVNGGGTSSTSYILLSKGSLITNGYSINIGSFASGGNENRVLNMTSSIISIRAGATSNTGWNYTGTNKILIAGGSHIRFLNNQSNAAHDAFVAADNDQYGDITFLSALSIRATLAGTAVIRKLTFTGNGLFLGNMTIDSLIFAPGKKYTFSAGTTQIINKYLKAISPACTGLLEISSASSAPANIHIGNSAVIDINSAIITNINATGSIPVMTNNSVDGEGNSGFAFPVPTSGKILYWVGGTGNWNDDSHWSLTNNGIYPALGGGCIPTLADTVIFNSNSGFTVSGNSVMLDGNGHYCNTMIWHGALNTPELTGGSGKNLIITGSVTLQAAMKYKVFSTYFTSSNSWETITTNGTVFGVTGDVNYAGNLYFNGSGGWTLQDDLTTGGGNYAGNSGSIIFYKGHLNTNGKKLNIYSFESEGNLWRELSLGASEITIRSDYGNNAGWVYTGSDRTLDAGTSHIIFSGTVALTTHRTFTGANSDQYHHISFTSPSSTVVTFRGPVKVRKLYFAANGTIVGNNSYDTLIFSADKKYNLNGNNTQTITKYFKARSSACAGLLEINSSSATLARISISSSATVLINRTLITNIQVMGGTPLVALNSIDNGGNINITFPPASGSALYWVGGSGSWNEAEHWSENNDGVFPASSGGCVPTPVDDVIFNANSGFTAANNIVTLDGSGHHCKNMIWNGASSTPEIVGLSTANRLNIYGSLTLQADMKYSVNNSYFLSGSSGQTITTNGVIIGGDVVDGNIYFSGSGEWILQDNLTTGGAGNLNFLKGKLNTNGAVVNIYRFISAGSEARDLLLGTSSIMIRGVQTGWSYLGTNKSLNAGTSAIVFLSVQSTVNTLSFQGDNNDVYHHISFSDPTSQKPGVNGPVRIQKLFFAGNGNIFKSNVFDTLIFTAGRVYELEAGFVQNINKAFFPSGNPCKMTTLRSSSSSRSTLNVLTGNIHYNYVTVSNIKADGSYVFWEMGAQSVDGGGNAGMNFLPYDANAAITGLGPDYVSQACTFSHLLTTDGFYPGPNTTFLWNNGSSGNTLHVNDAGTYAITVNYGEGCTVSDNITFSVANPCTTPLPIDLVSFELKNQHCGISVNWKTASETDNKQFELSRTEDGIEWEVIAIVEGAGNSGSERLYEIADNDISAGKTYYYMLKQVDYSGRTTFYDPQSITVQNCGNNLMLIYPNPAKDEVTVSVYLHNYAGNSSLSFSDASGRIVLRSEMLLTEGKQLSFNQNISLLPEGIYFVKLTTNQEENFPVEKLVISR